MKFSRKAFALIFCLPATAGLLFLAGAGCDSPTRLGAPASAPSGSSKGNSNPLAAYLAYAPAKLDITPLTSFVTPSKGEAVSQLTAYVCLLDSFDCQAKSPGVFRFELYEYVQRSPQPRGRRITIWPDIDLTKPAENNKYWRDYLRAYEFTLEVESGTGQPALAGQSFILQATCLCPSGKRLSDNFVLRHTR